MVRNQASQETRGVSTEHGGDRRLCPPRSCGLGGLTGRCAGAHGGQDGGKAAGKMLRGWARGMGGMGRGRVEGPGGQGRLGCVLCRAEGGIACRRERPSPPRGDRGRWSSGSRVPAWRRTGRGGGTVRDAGVCTCAAELRAGRAGLSEEREAVVRRRPVWETPLSWQQTLPVSTREAPCEGRTPCARGAAPRGPRRGRTGSRCVDSISDGAGSLGARPQGWDWGQMQAGTWGPCRGLPARGRPGEGRAEAVGGRLSPSVQAGSVPSSAEVSSASYLPE